VLRAGSQGFSTRGLSVPWHYQRRLIAERWHCKPREVELEPSSEINIELRIMQAEVRARK
jgi:hypothetical protein